MNIADLFIAVALQQVLLINCLICNFDVKADIVYGRNENGGNTAIVNKDGYEGNVDPTIIKIKE